MRRISFCNQYRRWRSLLVGSFLCLIGTASISAYAAQDVRGVKIQKPALKVIEEKCLFCHNRQRIDEAVKRRRDMEKILQSMRSKGVVLTGREHEVMGHFWRQNPFKSTPK